MATTSTPPPDSDRIAALSVRMSELEEAQAQKTWHHSAVDGLGIVALSVLAMFNKMDGMTAAVIIALLLGVRIPKKPKGGSLTSLFAPFLGFFGSKLGS